MSARGGEFDLIDRYFRPLAGKGSLNLGDDVALLAPVPGTELAITTDSIVAGIDFFPDDEPEAIAAKALRVNLSDLAAKGAEPFAYLLALGLADDVGERWVARFADGLAREHGRYAVDLLGGDTGRSGERTMVTITALGRVAKGAMVYREGASVGDVILVSGTIGDSALGLRIRKGDLQRPVEPDAAHLLRRYLLPEPRLAAGTALRRFASAAMDVSDGLLADLGTLCEASGLSAEIGAAKVPLSPAAARVLAGEEGALETILTGGDDYEVLCAVPEQDVAAFQAMTAAVEVPFTAIGLMREGHDAPTVRDADGATLSFTRLGHDHFAR